MLTNTNLAVEIWPDVESLFPLEAAGEIAALAATSDREGKFSEQGLRVLQRIGWPGLVVPKKFGGLGATLLESCAVQRRLGAADPALAIAGTMHLGSIAVWAEHYRRQPDMTWVFMEAVATHNLIVASAVSEATLGGSVNRSTLRAKRVDGGWEITGKKSPLSFANYADLISLQLQTEGSDNTPSQVIVALVPRSLPGISAKLTWDTMGMRGSGSDTLVLEKCVIPDSLVVYQGVPGAAEDDDIVAGIICFCLVLTATYFGLADAALGAARSLLGKMRIDHLNAVRSELPTFQGAIGQHVAALLTLESACAALAMRMDARANAQHLLAPALALKQLAIRLIPEIVGGLAEACGGASYSRSSPIERLWRDCQAIRFHPPTPAPVAQYLGRRALGVPAALDLDESSPRLNSAKDLVAQ